MDESLLERFRMSRVSPEERSGKQTRDTAEKGDLQMQSIKSMYSERVFQSHKIESVLFLDGQVTEENTLYIRLQLHEFIRLKDDPQFMPPPYLVLSIRSPGGDMIAAMALCSMIETVQSLGTPIIGVCNGIAYSAGFMILTACEYRYMLPHSHCMAHEAKTAISGTMSNLKQKTAMLKDYEDMALESILRIENDLTKSTAYMRFCKEEGEKANIVRFIKEKIELSWGDNFFRFDAAKDLGVIHGVITEEVYGLILSKVYQSDRNTVLTCANLRNVISHRCRQSSQHTDTPREALMAKIKANMLSDFPKVDPLPSEEWPN